MTKCRVCDKEARKRGYCFKHYKYLLQTGRLGQYRVDSARAREHICRLVDLRWTYEAIGSATGINPTFVLYLHRGDCRLVRADYERRILAIPLEPSASASVDATGARRRIQALARIGWSSRRVAERVGCSHRTLQNISAGQTEWISPRMAGRISAVYDELWATPGPDKGVASKARTLGHAPPLAWDDDTIDDPAARPEGVATSRGRKLPPTEELLFLIEAGETLAALAQRFRVKPESIERRFEREGIMRKLRRRAVA